MIAPVMAQKRGVHLQTSAPHKAHTSLAGSVLGSVQSYPAGFGGAAQSVVADFNGDGIPDLAVVNPCDSSNCGAGYASIAVLIANSDGSLQAPVLYAVGTFEPMSVAAGDFNGDGAIDLVVASQCPTSTSCGTGQVSIILNNGDGTFQSPVPYSTGTGSSYFVATGDFNGDGILDLAVANQTSANSVIAILLGNGDGTFQAPLSYSTGSVSAAFLAVGDFNLDGAIDLVVVNSGTQDTISILLGNGDGTYQNAVIYPSGGAFATAAAVGDFNGDGVPDLAVVNSCATYNNLSCSQSGSIAVMRGNGDGTFQAPTVYGSGGNEANSIAIADFDGDGNLDLAVSNLGPSAGGSSAGVLSLMLGNGDGTFQSAVTFSAGGSFTSYVSAGDFNGDGQPDLAVVSQCPSSGSCTNGVMGVLLNTASNFTLYASATALSSSKNPDANCQAVVLTATVHSAVAGTPTGNVTFYAGETPLTTVPISGGTATYTASFAAPGPQPLLAVYSGDTSHAPSASPVLNQILGMPVALTSSQNPSAFNQAVTFTATVGGSSGKATGTVTFMDGATSLGTFNLVNGSVFITSSALTVGDHSMTASYSPTGSYHPGAAIMTQSVSQASMTVLESSANPANTNQAITYTAAITGQYGGSPTGTVAFMQGSPPTVWATAPVINGVATVTNSFNKANTYPITAVYLGSNDYQSSSSAGLNQIVNLNVTVTTTTTLLATPSPSYINQPVTFTATVSPISGTIPNGEMVTFYSGSSTLGTSTTAAGQAVFSTSSLPVGTDPITATYAGDGTYQTSTSRAVNQVVKLNPTNTSLTSSLSPSAYGQSVTFTVAVTPQSGSGTPTGTVTVKNGSTVIGSIQLANSGGTLTPAPLPAGSLSISASYSGDANFASSTASTLTQTVNVATTSTTLTSTPNPASLNQNVTFTATVVGQYGGKVGGTVTFTQGSTVLGTAALAPSKATITYTFSTTGTDPIVATYSGDANDSGSASAVVNQVVNEISTTTTLTSSATHADIGQAITFTATVTPASGAVPDGETVTFYDGSVSFGTGMTKSGVASLTTSSLALGTHTITAGYAGDASYQTSTSKALSQVVSLNASVTTLGPSVNPSSYGQSVTLTAKVAATSGSTVPTGKVTFKNGSTVLSSVSLVNGSAAYTTATLAAGSSSVSATYGGDSNFSTSSATLTQVVNQATTATTLSSTPNPSSLSQNVTFTAVVTGAYQGTVSGSVTFMNGQASLGSAPIANGKATLSNAFTAGGTDSITAVYAGDSNNQGSTSGAVSQVVNSDPTTTTLSSSGSPAFVGQAVTFTATVTSSYGAIPDGEMVTFYSSGASIGTANTKRGAAAFTTSTLTAGAHSITATYAGDSSYLTSTSKPLSQTISKNSTTTALSSNANPSAYGQAVTFTATVTSAGPVATGTITFKNGTAPLGTASLNSQGAATLTTLTLGAGVYPITAAYNGDNASSTSTSATVNQSVNAAATATQIFSSVNPAAVGESVTFTAIVRSATTFATGSVTFTVGSTTLGSATLMNGLAKLAVTTLPAGADVITATYSASANVAGSSASMVQNVE
jgi:hypothetical protein